TADAVFQNLDILRSHSPRIVLVLAGDHIYKMDYSRMIDDHVARRAEMTVGCVEVPMADAAQFGTLQVDDRYHVLGFREKQPDACPVPGRPDAALASMGIYAFDPEFLYDQIERDARDKQSSHDFGYDLIPRLVAEGRRVSAHRLEDSCRQLNDGKPYWRD